LMTGPKLNNRKKFTEKNYSKCDLLDFD